MRSDCGPNELSVGTNDARFLVLVGGRYDAPLFDARRCCAAVTAPIVIVVVIVVISLVNTDAAGGEKANGSRHA